MIIQSIPAAAEELDQKAKALSSCEDIRGGVILLMAASVTGVALGLILMTGSFVAAIFGALTTTLCLLGFFALRDVYLIISHLEKKIQTTPDKYLSHFPQSPLGAGGAAEERAGRVGALVKQFFQWILEAAEETPTLVFSSSAFFVAHQLICKIVDQRLAAKEQLR